MIVGRRPACIACICDLPRSARSAELHVAPMPRLRPADGSQRSPRNMGWWWRRRRAPRVSGSTSCSQGGNAVDAAVATGFALAVAYRRAGNIGGGGYMLVHLAGRNLDTAIDYRETAPAATTPEIFLDQRGEAIRRSRAIPRWRSAYPARSRGSPSRTAKYGSGQFTLAQLIAPAIQLAREGIPIEDDTAELAAAFTGAPGPLAVHGEDLLRRRPRARSRRDPGTEGPRRYACRDRPVGAGSVLRGCDRREDRQRRAPRRRPDEARRSQELSGGRACTGAGAAIAATMSLDTAILLRGRDPDRNAQHPGRLPRSCRGMTRGGCT